MKMKEDWEERKGGRGGWQEKDGSHNRLSNGEEENCRREKGLGEKQSECSLFRVDKV